MDVPRSELQDLMPNNNGDNGNGNSQVENNEDQINNNPDGNENGQRENNGAGKGCVPKEFTYVSLVVNGIFFGLVFMFFGSLPCRGE